MTPAVSFPGATARRTVLQVLFPGNGAAFYELGVKEPRSSSLCAWRQRKYAAASGGWLERQGIFGLVSTWSTRGGGRPRSIDGTDQVESRFVAARDDAGLDYGEAVADARIRSERGEPIAWLPRSGG